MLRIRKLVVSLVLFLATLFISALAHAEPAIWVVKGPHATVYLFGTIHALDKDHTWHSAKVDAAIKNSQSLWLEISNPDDAATMQPMILQLGMDMAHPLSSKLTPEQLAKLNKAAAGLPGGASILEPMKPWLAGMMISLAPVLHAGFDPNSAVELQLKPEFTSANKPIKGFETAEQQIHYFADLPEKEQLDFLVSELDDVDTAVDKFKELVAAWYAGDVDKLESINNSDLREKHPALFQTLVVKRNQNFAAQIQDMLKGDAITFVAIGAGHLVGKEGVPAMLENQGYKVTRQ
jgi:uncharacterized protein YbaP (TraB family)